MSSDEIAIRVSNLSKRYEIYDTPRDRLKQFMLPRAQRLLGRPTGQYFREFWALNDVSFEIRRGETVGVIGRNGSGKSTLLQMICGTLTPTSGSIETSGRIAALLELGSGFNPEFTGRENIYMNASVLGLSVEEIDARYDDIVAFADIGQFVEQPVKTYSSGMYLRLAFAVIAHVDADILVVDEALAVGDAVFTQKCMRFIRKFQERGTLIFVSHDTASVQNLCRSGIWLKHGRVEQLGTAKAVSEAYLQYTLQEIYGAESKLTSVGGAEAGDATSAPPLASDYGTQASVRDNLSDANGWKTGHADIVSVALTKLSDETDAVFEGDERVRMTVRARAHQALERPILGFLVRDRLGQDLFGENTLHFTGLRPTPVAAGALFEGVFEFRLPMLPNGQYAVMASVADGDLQNHVQHHWLHDALIINISSSKIRYGLVGLPFTRAELEVIHE
ncbi:ABC transporter ATP-binding protein [Janthinobacterium sp. PC23-8]|uniref:ABC transporter ATP-binding protein n=1 Tax=Janthinobacterium sp. PC23-8 TaxID=2012679 RepID=UPI000B96390E|nr:ABC transporter ATP-binding protein [Janthinobacterium sp. PC23-8]OYO30700.1 ABC transporter ATP-binding protein [Janthinobacterium sp. PC23-8]